MSGARSVWWAAGSLVMLAVAAFAPWAARSGRLLNSPDDELVGMIAFVAALAIVVCVVMRKPRVAAVPLLVGIAAVMLVGHDIGDPAGPFGGPGPNIHLKWGIWLALAGTIGLVLTSAALLLETGGIGMPSGRVRRVVRTGRGRCRARTDSHRVAELIAGIERQPRRKAVAFVSELIAGLPPRVAADVLARTPPTARILYGGAEIRIVLTSPESWRRLRETRKEPFTVEWIERSLRAGDVFFDVGANVGSYSLIAAKAAEERVRVFAFEPAAPTFGDLCRNVFLNGCSETIVPLQLALWSETRLLVLNYRSLKAGDSQHRLTTGLPTKESAVFQTVLAVRLDDLVEQYGLPAPTLMKIDVDGPTLEVLRGGRRTLARPQIRSIMLELPNRDREQTEAVTALLAECGFGHGKRHTEPGRSVAYWSFTR